MDQRELGRDTTLTCNIAIGPWSCGTADLQLESVHVMGEH